MQLGVLPFSHYFTNLSLNEILFKSTNISYMLLKRFSFLCQAIRVGKQAGSLAEFGFSVGFERPDNVPACVSWQPFLKTILKF
jgi:hypothetical protein